MKLLYLGILAFVLAVTLAKSDEIPIPEKRPATGCWVYDYDTSAYQRCEDQNLTLKAEWKQFYNYNDEKES